MRPGYVGFQGGVALSWFNPDPTIATTGIRGKSKAKAKAASSKRNGADREIGTSDLSKAFGGQVALAHASQASTPANEACKRPRIGKAAAVAHLLK